MIGSDSVNRFMMNDKARAGVRAPWPLVYYKKGAQCSEIEATARKTPGGEADKLLVAVRRQLGECDSGTGSQQMGDYVSFSGASHEIVVKDGQVSGTPDNLPQPLCVLTIDRSGPGSRSIANCDRAFSTR